MLFCQNCGNGNNTNDPICAHCGHQILYGQMEPIVSNNNKRKKITIATVILGIIIALVTWGIISFRDMQTNETINLGNDSIPTIYAIVGERSIIGISREWSNDERVVTITYASGAVSAEDIETYVEALLSRYHFVTLENLGFGIVTLGTRSVNQNRILLVDIRFSSHGETIIMYTKTEGDLTNRHD